MRQLDVEDKKEKEYFDRESERFEAWVKRYNLEIDETHDKLRITRKINDWTEFYLGALNWGFKYVGNKELVFKRDAAVNWIKLLSTRKKRK
jgi:hypothetical protein